MTSAYAPPILASTSDVGRRRACHELKRGEHRPATGRPAQTTQLGTRCSASAPISWAPRASTTHPGVLSQPRPIRQHHRLSFAERDVAQRLQPQPMRAGPPCVTRSGHRAPPTPRPRCRRCSGAADLPGDGHGDRGMALLETGERRVGVVVATLSVRCRANTGSCEPCPRSSPSSSSALVPSRCCGNSPKAAQVSVRKARRPTRASPVTSSAARR